MMKNDYLDTAAFNLLLEGFRCASESEENLIEEYIRVGGFTICLRFAGKGLVSQLMPALSHLSIQPAGPPNLTICLWDTASTGMQLHPLLDICRNQIRSQPHKYLTPRQEIRLISNARIPATYESGSNVLSMFDPQRDLAVYWVDDGAALPYYERGAPVRTILNWWLSQHDMQCVHAGAVGVAEGGVLLIGKGGSGKSTTALACLESDLLYASDDYCLVGTQPSPYVYSLYNTAKLRGSLDIERQPHFLPMLDNPERMDDEKLMIFVGQHLPHKLQNGFPLKAILLPTVTSNIDTKTSPVSAGEALRSLVPTTLFQLPGAAEQAFRRMTRLVQQLPCYRLELGSDIKASPGVILDLIHSELGK